MQRPIEDDFSIPKYEGIKFRKQENIVSPPKQDSYQVGIGNVEDYSRFTYDNDESSDQYNNEEIIQSILETFKFTRERFEELNDESTKFVRTFWSTMNEKQRELYFHYKLLNPFLDSYLQFGADKCSVRDIHRFCRDLNIEYDDILVEIEKFPLGMDTVFEDEHKVFRGMVFIRIKISDRVVYSH